jgi:hypothetical protein
VSRFLEGHGGRLARFAMSVNGVLFACSVPFSFIFLIDKIRGSLVVFAPTVNDIFVDCGSMDQTHHPR